MQYPTGPVVYLVTDRPLAGARSLPDLIADAIRSGVTVVQLREKNASSREFYELAAAVHRVTNRLGVPLIINDRVDIMLAVGAEGVHIGSDDLPPERVRELAVGRILGCSAGSFEELRRAENAGADYVGIGPVFPTPTKPDAGPALGIDGLANIVREARIPSVAIGGINVGNAADVRTAGAAGIAVVSAVMAAPDVGAAVRSLRDVFLPEEPMGLDAVAPVRASSAKTA